MDIQNTDKIIYFIRHGKDDAHYRGGWSKRGLTKEGNLQAKNLANRLAERKDIMNIGTIITSDLPRAVQTAEPVCMALDIEPIHMPCWRETNNGKLAGMPNDEAETLYPGLYWSSLKLNEKYPEGESPMDFFNRVRNAFVKLKNDVESNAIESNVAVFTHCGVINILYCIAKRKRWTNRERYLSIPFTGVYAYNVTKNTFSRYM